MGNVDIAVKVLPGSLDMVAFVESPTDHVGPDQLALLHPELRSAWISAVQRVEYEGLPGFVEGWRDWLEPYSRYDLSTEQLIEKGDRAISLVNVVAVTRHDAVELTHSPAAVWTFEDGVVVKVEFYLERDAALAAVGD